MLYALQLSSPLPPACMTRTDLSPFQHACDELRRHPRSWLVTGAAGFIGSNLVQELLGLGQSVVGLDNLTTGYRANLDAAVALAGPDAGSFRFIEGDIRTLGDCHAACEGVDLVLHHAAQVSVPGSIADPILSMRVNVEGFVNVLMAARDGSVRRIVYASSSAVYGDATTIPQVEQETGRLLSPYAASKATNELYALVFQGAYGLETVGLRYFNIFGPRQDPDGAYAAVIPRWISNLLCDVPCQVFGDGLTSRDFCYVANVVQANILAALTNEPGATGEVYNVACGEETSLNELFSILQGELAPFRPEVMELRPQYAPARVGDILRSAADINKARTRFGFRPSHDTAAGIRDAMQWYRTQSDAIVPARAPGTMALHELTPHALSRSSSSPT